MGPVERAIRFLARTERCRQTYLPVIASGFAWAPAILLAAPLSALAASSGTSLGGLAVAVAVMGYFAVSSLLRLDEDRASVPVKAATLALIAQLAAIERLVRFPSVGDKILLLILAMPTVRRVAGMAQKIEPMVSLAAALTASAASTLILYGDSRVYIDLLAAAEIT